MREKKGITLIALVVTIVILIILAAVSINMLIGENGLIQQAKESSIKQDNSTVMETLSMLILGERTNQKGEEIDALRYLKNNAYVNDAGIIDVSKVVGNKLSTGNGTNSDIYIIEGADVYYIYSNGEKVQIGKIDTSVLEETPASYFDFDPDSGTIWLKQARDYYTDPNFTIDIDTIVVPSQIDGVAVTKIR